MQHIKAIAIAAVLTFGIGGAVIASNSTQTANVMNIAPEGQPENWQPLPPGHKGCDNDTDRACTGFKDASGNVTTLAYGNELP